MSRRKRDAAPEMRHHRASGQAIVRIGGRTIYLGAWGSEAAQRRFDDLVAGSRPLSWLVPRFLEWAKGWYKSSAEVREFRIVGEEAARIAGTTPLIELKVSLVRELQRSFEGCKRRVINQRCKRLVRMLRWAAGEGIIEPHVAERLAAVPGFRGTGDSEPVEPVDEALAMRVASKMAKPWRDAVRLQLLTGMRPGDCLAVHVDLIERRDGFAVYRPQAKMAHCGRKCAIVLNKQAVELLDARGHVDGFYFPGRSKGHLVASSYAHAVARACVACGAEHWHPHQLRHTFATRLRAAGARVEDVQASLGHAALSTTEVYAERDLDRIASIVARASGSL